jgi:hypothetical protein
MSTTARCFAPGGRRVPGARHSRSPAGPSAAVGQRCSHFSGYRSAVSLGRRLRRVLAGLAAAVGQRCWRPRPLAAADSGGGSVVVLTLAARGGGSGGGPAVWLFQRLPVSGVVGAEVAASSGGFSSGGGPAVVLTSSPRCQERRGHRCCYRGGRKLGRQPRRVLLGSMPLRLLRPCSSPAVRREMPPSYPALPGWRRPKNQAITGISRLPGSSRP